MCGCGKNKPKVNPGPSRIPSVTAQSTTQYNLRVNNTPRTNANVQAQQVQVNPVNPVNPNVQAQQVNNTTNADTSPAGLDAQSRRVAQLRRNAIRRALGR